MIAYICEDLGDDEKYEEFGFAVRNPDISEEDAQKLLETGKRLIQEAQGLQEIQNPYNIDENLVPVVQGTEKCTYYGKGSD